MKKTLFLITLLLPIILTSCSHYYYVPNTQNVPLLREKNEFQGAVLVGGGDEVKTVEVQAAYAVTNNLAVMTNFMAARGGERSGNNWGNGKYLEGAVGYYKPFDELVVAEVYAGLGVSNQHHQYGTDTYNEGTADLSFMKYFLQPSVGFSFKYFDIAISTRLSRLSFYTIDNNITMDNYNSYYVDTISQNKVSYLFEPALTLRGGVKNVKVQLQLSSSKNLSHSNLKFENANASIGLIYTIANRYRKTVPEN